MPRLMAMDAEVASGDGGSTAIDATASEGE